jgi:hypothetical protein
LVVRSFASPITIFDGAVITIQRVRQQLEAGERSQGDSGGGRVVSDGPEGV